MLEEILYQIKKPLLLRPLSGNCSDKVNLKRNSELETYSPGILLTLFSLNQKLWVSLQFGGTIYKQKV